MNLDARFGTPKWSFSFGTGTCSVTLTFPKRPMDWKEVSRFQLEAAQKILNVFGREGVQLDRLTFKLYSRQGEKLEGVATTSSSDDKNTLEALIGSHMGLRLRKSIKVLPGLKLNLSKSGVSVTAGRGEACVNLNSRGTRATVGLPGTGISYSAKVGGGKKAAEAQPVMEPGPRLKKPVSLLGKLGIWFLWAMLCAPSMQKVVALVMSIVLTVVTVKLTNKRRERANAAFQ